MWLFKLTFISFFSRHNLTATCPLMKPPHNHESAWAYTFGRWWNCESLVSSECASPLNHIRGASACVFPPTRHCQTPTLQTNLNLLLGTATWCIDPPLSAPIDAPRLLSGLWRLRPSLPFFPPFSFPFPFFFCGRLRNLLPLRCDSGVLAKLCG